MCAHGGGPAPIAANAGASGGLALSDDAAHLVAGGARTLDRCQPGGQTRCTLRPPRSLWPLSIVFALGCPAAAPPPPPCSEPLFGRPVAATGLDAAQCRPSCACSTTFTAREWTPAQVSALLGWTLDAPFAEVSADPYAADGGADAGVPGEVCAVVVTDQPAHHYRVQTFASADAAAQASALLTHHDACGVCSTLADLAVYAKNPDLGAPVRQCGLDTFSQGVRRRRAVPRGARLHPALRADLGLRHGAHARALPHPLSHPAVRRGLQPRRRRVERVPAVRRDRERPRLQGGGGEDAAQHRHRDRHLPPVRRDETGGALVRRLVSRAITLRTRDAVARKAAMISSVLFVPLAVAR